MKPRIVIGGVLSSIAVLVIGWQLGGQTAVTTPSTVTGTGGTSSGSGTTSGTGTTGSGTSGSSSSGSSSSGSSSSGSSSSGSSSSGTASSGVSGTFDGTTTETRFGPVQVEIVVANGTITDVKALQLTNDSGRSIAISNQAAPILRQEALAAQSSSIQSVSGATYTSDGYVTSLQSAIDQAGL